MASGAPTVAGRRTLDIAGAVILAVSVGWTLWSARGSSGDPLPVIALQTGCAGAYATARAATRWQRPVVPVAVVAVVSSVLVVRSVLPTLVPDAPPLGYVNANAALYVLTAVAASMVAAAFPYGPATAVALPLAAAFALGAVVSGSVTGMVVLCLAVVVLAARAVHWPPLLVGGSALLVLTVVSVTAALALDQLDDTAPAAARAGDVLDERRVLLWRDAAEIAHRHPVDGAGPGTFRELSPLARQDADARWAHSGFLQQGAEAGAVGMALLLAAFGWGFARVWEAGPDDPLTALGAVALAGLGLHASVDYVLHFPAVPLVAVALLGAATAPTPVSSTSPVTGSRRSSCRSAYRASTAR